ncbi:hypothetical protein [Streptomyces sp. NPDC097981]|uniref:hypothetical protein n=1 Tax=Streptomyces sp. NPDC097981 TaxID=3155428 RepID=UPI0033261FFF
MTLQSDRSRTPEAATPTDRPEAADGADRPDPADVADVAGAVEPAYVADAADGAGSADVGGRVRGVLQGADQGAGWAFGGPDGIHGGSVAGGRLLDVGGLVPVLALWPVIGSLVAEEALRLHTPLAAYGAEAASGTPVGATTHHLLSHSTGPAAHAALTRLAEHLTGSPLAELAATRIWHPLGMTGTRFADGTLYAPLTDLARFLGHLLSPADHAVSRGWVSESLRIRTGELNPARGLLWHPAPHGTWSYGESPTVWVSPRVHRWAILLPTHLPGPLRQAFREAVFAPTPYA